MRSVLFTHHLIHLNTKPSIFQRTISSTDVGYLHSIHMWSRVPDTYVNANITINVLIAAAWAIIVITNYEVDASTNNVLMM